MGCTRDSFEEAGMAESYTGTSMEDNGKEHLQPRTSMCGSPWSVVARCSLDLQRGVHWRECKVSLGR